MVSSKADLVGSCLSIVKLPEKLLKRHDAIVQRFPRGVGLGSHGGSVQHHQGRVEFAALTFAQNASEQRPDVGFGPIKLPALSGAMNAELSWLTGVISPPRMNSRKYGFMV